jgi:hypothetical protein
MTNIALLEILARLNPRIYEIIHPHVPVLVGGFGPLAEVDEVELNPQPLPPREVVAAAMLARRLGDAAVLVNAQTQGGQGFLQEIVDEWCGTRGPRPWPPGWPHVVEPDPHPWDVAQVFAVASLVFAGFAASLEDGQLREAFRAAADTTGERAVKELASAS